MRLCILIKLLHQFTSLIPTTMDSEHASQLRNVKTSIFIYLLIEIIEIEQSKGIKEGSWDSIHVVTVSLEQKKARYRVASNVFLKMLSTSPIYGDLEIAGSISRSVIIFNLLTNQLLQKEDTCQMDAKSGEEFHIANIGKVIEANETEIRSEMDGIYINKTKQIINTGRLKEEYMTQDEKINFQNELANAVSQIKLNAKVINQ